MVPPRESKDCPAISITSRASGFPVSPTCRAISRVRILGQRYVAFTQGEHISNIHGTVMAIWNQWLPRSRLKVADAPNFERYGETSIPTPGDGDLEMR